jgi:aminodeoxychorismate synthase component I
MARYETAYAEDRSSRAGFLLGREDLALQEALLQPQRLPSLLPLRASLTVTQAQYAEQFARIREHLYAGDIYQANISIGLTTPFTGEPLSLYDKLRKVAKVPFGAFIDDGHGAILSASMERFLRGERTEHGYLLETRPIKGTRPRRKHPEEDRAQREALSLSLKDRAEHVMIVDLERNDLGRVAVGGGVEVADLFAVNAHETVYHMESTVRALCRPQVGIAEIFRAMFPTGSITGAPKRRAMEIISQIEGAPRGVYCGAIGYFDDRGGFDFSVGIRTAELRNGELLYRAGGGLVVDSDPELEWQECNWKAEAFIKAISG